MKRVIMVLPLVCLLLTGCQTITPEHDIFTNSEEFLNFTPEEWVVKLSNSIGVEEKNNYDLFEFVYFYEEDITFEVLVKSGELIFTLYYKWSDELQDFTVGNSME